MDHQSDRILGLDIAGGRRKAVEVAVTKSGARITSISSHLIDERVRPESEPNGTKNYLSIADNLVMVKEVSIANPDYDNIEGQIKFELKHSLPEDPEQFCYDTIATDQKNRFICLLTRKTVLSDLLTKEKDISGFKMRGVALGLGFLRYCDNQPGGPICLTDFSDRRASLCFIKDNRIVALGHFDWQRLTSGSDRDMYRLAAELKTFLNFKLNSLSRHYQDVELESLYICGHSFPDEDIEILERKLALKVGEPALRPCCLSESVSETGLAAKDFLVALGLTTE